LLSLIDNEKDVKLLETLMILGEDVLESIRDNDIDTDVVKILAKSYFERIEKIELRDMVNELERENDGFNKITPKALGFILQNLNIKKKRAGAGGNTTISIKENKLRIEYYIKYHKIKEEDLIESDVE
jgi:hypothetical protein